MGIADMDFQRAPSITQALKERMKHENWGYLDMRARPYRADRASSPGTRSATASTSIPTTMVHHHRRAPRPDRRAARRSRPRAARCCCRRRPTTASTATCTSRRPSAEESPAEGRQRQVRDGLRGLRAAHQPSTRNTFILCNPQNPTGNCWTRRRPDRASVRSACSTAWSCWPTRSTATGSPRARSTRRSPACPNKAIVNNSLTFKAASKSFGLAAMKCAWFFSTNKDLLGARQGQPPRRPERPWA